MPPRPCAPSLLLITTLAFGAGCSSGAVPTGTPPARPAARKPPPPRRRPAPAPDAGCPDKLAWTHGRTVALNRRDGRWSLSLSQGERVLHRTDESLLPTRAVVVQLRAVRAAGQRFVHLRGLDTGRLTDLYWQPESNVVHRTWRPYRDPKLDESDLLDDGPVLCVGPHHRHRAQVAQLRKIVIPHRTLDLTPRAFGRLLVRLQAAAPAGANLPGWLLHKNSDAAMVITQGAFTAKGVTEALVGGYGGTWHHAQWQLWLLRRQGGRWKAARHVTASCGGDYRTVDVQGDGRRELLVSTVCTHQGDAELSDALWSLDAQGPPRPLFEASGRTKTGAALNGLAEQSHRLQLIDLDGDGRLELIDHQRRGYFRRTGKSRGSAYLRRLTLRTQRAYRLHKGRYRPIPEAALPALLERAFPNE